MQNAGMRRVLRLRDGDSERGCYDPVSSLRKRNDVQGKGWLDFNSLGLTNGLARADLEDNVSGAGASGSKG